VLSKDATRAHDTEFGLNSPLLFHFSLNMKSAGKGKDPGGKDPCETN